MELPEKTRFQLLAPMSRERKGEYIELFKQMQTQGLSRVIVDGSLHNLADEPPKLAKNKKHSIEVVVDRLQVKAGAHQRLTESVETALGLADGLVIADFVDLPDDDPQRPRRSSERLAGPNDHPLAVAARARRAFQLHAPSGAC